MGLRTADCGLRIADCGFVSTFNHGREIELKVLSIRNPQSAICNPRPSLTNGCVTERAQAA